MSRAFSLIIWKVHNKTFHSRWAREFDRRAQELIISDHPADVISVLELSDAYRAVPTLEHFLPAAYIAGVVKASGDHLETFVDGGDWGSVTMTSFQTV